MINIGKYNELLVLRSTSVGLYLGDNEGNDVLLPLRYIPQVVDIGDKLTVFVYLDSDHRIIATTLTPKMEINEFGCLQVRSITNDGAFLDWGVAKDIFVPFAEQSENLQVGEFYIVYIYLDEQTNRIAGSCNILKFLEKENINLIPYQEVDLLCGSETDLGYNVIINNKYRGLVYKNEVFKPLQYGDKMKGYIKSIREDKKIDVSIQRIGYKIVEDNEQRVLDEITKANGKLYLTDVSNPEEIVKKLQMSKKTYKKILGALYKKRLINISSECITLTNVN